MADEPATNQTDPQQQAPAQPEPAEASPQPEGAQPEAGGQPEGQPAQQQPPEWVPYKAMSERIGKKNETIQTLEQKVQDLEQRLEGQGSPSAPQQSQDPQYNNAQKAIQDAVKPVVEGVDQRVQQLEQQIQQQQTVQQFERHRENWRQYVRENFPHIPQQVVNDTEKLVDQSLEAGQPIDPMIPLQKLYGEYMLQSGPQARQQAQSAAQEVSQANQTAVTSGRPSQSPQPTEDLSGKDIREMTDEEYQQFVEQHDLLNTPI